MLRIQSNDYLISIPDKLTEVTIYTTTHYKDENGQRLDIPPSHDRFYLCGDIFIETPFTRYVFRDVKSAYSYPAKINKIIGITALSSRQFYNTYKDETLLYRYRIDGKACSLWLQ